MDDAAIVVLSQQEVLMWVVREDDMSIPIGLDEARASRKCSGAGE